MEVAGVLDGSCWSARWKLLECSMEVAGVLDGSCWSARWKLLECSMEVAGVLNGSCFGEGGFLVDNYRIHVEGERQARICPGQGRLIYPPAPSTKLWSLQVDEKANSLNNR